MNSPEKQFVRLSPLVLDALAANRRRRPTRDSFVRYCRSKGVKGEIEHKWWKALNMGESVPRDIGEAFITNLSRREGFQDFNFENGLIPAGRPISDPNEIDLWKWPRIVDLISEQFKDVDEMYVHRPKTEIPWIAREGMKFVGREVPVQAPSLSDEEALLRGQAIMKRSLEDYTHWLMEILNKEHRSIMFHICRCKVDGQQEWKRTGFAIFIPLKDQSFSRFCQGKLDEREIGASRTPLTS